MFDPAHLESFLTVARTRNFTQAGRRLGLQQSTVSQHIRKLEDSAGRRLFVRDTHHVTLTALWTLGTTGLAAQLGHRTTSLNQAGALDQTAARRNASSTSTATRRDTPGSFIVTPTS